MEVKLTQNKVALIDDVDMPVVSKYKWCAVKCSDKYYALNTKTIQGKRQGILMHRLILGIVPGFDVDHINGNTLDNRRENLRHATRSQNLMNQRKTHGSSKYKGVYWKERENKWSAQIKCNRRKYSLGNHSTEVEAAKAYNKAAIKHFGKFALLNKI